MTNAIIPTTAKSLKYLNIYYSGSKESFSNFIISFNRPRKKVMVILENFPSNFYFLNYLKLNE